MEGLNESVKAVLSDLGKHSPVTIIGSGFEPELSEALMKCFYGNYSVKTAKEIVHMVASDECEEIIDILNSYGAVVINEAELYRNKSSLQKALVFALEDVTASVVIRASKPFDNEGYDSIFLEYINKGTIIEL